MVCEFLGRHGGPQRQSSLLPVYQGQCTMRHVSPVIYGRLTVLGHPFLTHHQQDVYLHGPPANDHCTVPHCIHIKKDVTQNRTYVAAPVAHMYNDRLCWTPMPEDGADVGPD